MAGGLILSYFHSEKTATKDLKQIQKEMRDVMRQITACVTFLPLLDCACKCFGKNICRSLNTTNIPFAITNEYQFQVLLTC